MDTPLRPVGATRPFACDWLPSLLRETPCEHHETPCPLDVLLLDVLLLDALLLDALLPDASLLDGLLLDCVQRGRGRPEPPPSPHSHHQDSPSVKALIALIVDKVRFR